LTDLNGDAHRDLAVANFGENKVSVRLNRGDGVFGEPAAFAAGSSPYWLAAADLTGDSKPDLVVANAGSQSVSVLLNRGTGEFSPSVEYAAGSGPVGLALADLNGNGNIDIAVADYNYGDGSVAMSGMIRILDNGCEAKLSSP